MFDQSIGRIPLNRILFFAIVISSCGLAKTQNTVSAGSAETAKDEIVFLEFEINNTKGETTLRLINKIKTEGTLKKRSGGNKAAFENYLTVDVYNSDKLLNTTTLEHPLYKNMEYLNDSDALVTKFVSLDSAEFFIRVQIHGGSSKVKISEKLKDKTLKELTTLKL